jgi:hypothetical protein
MRVNSLEIEVFELTPAVAVTMGRRNYEDEEEEPEEGDEEDEPEEMLWRSSTTFDYPWLGSLRSSLRRSGQGETRTIVLNNLVTTVERNNDD